MKLLTNSLAEDSGLCFVMTDSDAVKISQFDNSTIEYCMIFVTWRRAKLICFLKFLFVDSSKESHTSSSDNQITDNNRYENAFFGLSVEKLEGWYAMSAEELNSAFANIAIR